MDYFKSFPTLSYDGITLTNLFMRFKIREMIKNNVSAYYTYTLQDTDRPDIVASKYYGSSNYTWILFFANDIIDPIFDWLLPYEEFNTFLANKYRGNNDKRQDYEIVSYLQSTNHHYENANGFIVDERTVVEDNYIGYSPVSIYEYENRKNEAKRNIKIIDSKYLGQLIREYREIFR